MAIDNELVVAEQLHHKAITPYEENEKEINKSTCKLCQSKFRKQAEQEYDNKRKNVTAVVNFLKNKNETISYNAVRNHLHFHYDLQSRKTIVSEYGKDVIKWVKGLGTDRADAIRARIALLDREAVSIASESDDIPLEEKRKSVEIVSKLYATIEKLERHLLELEKVQEPAAIVVNQLQIIIQEEMKNIKTVETKKVLVHILEQLQNQVGEFVLE
tara:strand:- start:5057 stop:5701 length:645 start_codon:yes stop_codon:yes gene_type:complete